MATFQTISDNETPFLKITQDAVDLLESITPAEKAQAVPYLLIWQVNPKTGAPVHGKDGIPTAPLSLKMVEPPRFGSSVDVRYRERADVSLERVSIRTENPRGIITYRQLEISIIIHRPAALFEDPTATVDNWATLLVPGTVYAMEYGWRASKGVKNGILNGEGYTNLQSKPPIAVPGIQRIRFTVTNYSFNIQANGQIAVTIQAYEDGEFNLRRAIPGLQAALDQTPNERVASKKNAVIPDDSLIDPHSSDGKKVIAELQRRIIVKLKSRASKKGLVSFQDVADTLFADVITNSYRSLGYNPPALVMGNFNDRAGRTGKRYGDLQLSSRPIGEFLVPMKEIEQKLGNMLKLGEQLTFYNFVNNFLSLLRDPRCWDSKLAKRDKNDDKLQAIPEVVARSIINKKDVTFYIFDVKREFTKFSSKDRFTTEELGAVTRDQIRDKLRKKGVPMITFAKGNSYIVGSNFEATADDQIKTIFMRRYLRPTRQEIQDASIKLKEDTLVDPRQLLYSSAIAGEITMIGNFAFDLFSLVWVDFDVRRWDGPFFIKSREDTITSSEFTTKVEIVSAGDDPLGTQGRDQIEGAKKAIVEEKKTTAKKPEKREEVGFKIV